MSELLGKLMAKKGRDENMSPEHKQAKMKVLKDLHDEMSKMMSGDLHGLKKVTVAAPDKQGLQEGLSKAQDLMSHGTHLDDDSANGEDGHEHEADDESMMSDGGMVNNADAPFQEDAMEHNPDLQDDHSEEDDEELEAKIKELQEKLSKRKKA